MLGRRTRAAVALWLLISGGTACRRTPPPPGLSHDGSIATLEGVLNHYASGGHLSRFRSRAIGGFKLTPTERANLLAFLHSLTDETLLRNPAFGPPR